MEVTKWLKPSGNGSRSRQEFSQQVDTDFAYLVQIETIEAQMGSQTERSKDQLRVTMVFRRGNDGWRIHHRHADSQTAVFDPQ
jgi:ketosteroid isomerase-like protein